MDSYDFHMKNFDAKAAKNAVAAWICNKMNAFGTDSKAVIGISGGKDSSVVAALCVEAIGKDRVYGVMMPGGDQGDLDDAKEVIRWLNITGYLINIRSTCSSFKNMTELVLAKPSEQALINMPARVRMVYLYMIAQTLGNAFVINTCNLSEDWVGYSTWHGDSAGDFSPLAKFTSDEVVAIGDACGLPYTLTHKTPSDGLCGETDEDKLGFTYHVLNKYIICNEFEDWRIKEKIDNLHKKNKFKLEPLDFFPVGKWQFKKTNS